MLTFSASIGFSAIKGAGLKVTNARKGFTLVEILTVISIAILLASLSMISFSGIQSSKFGDSVSVFSDYLKQVQMAAQASNSYVWVGFVQNSTTLEAVALEGTAGTSSDLANGQTKQLAIPLLLQGVVLDPSGKLEASPPGSTTTAQTISQSTLGSSSSGTFTYTVGGITQTFSNVVGFSPTGQVFLTSPNTLSHWIQMGLAPYPYNSSTSLTPKNFGVLFVAGLTGEIDVYRP